MGGNFPTKYEDILALKGVGNYTAAAIASFAYDLPHAVVDGNVYRVLARYFGIETPIDTTEGKKQFSHLANELLNKKQAALYNQGIMDLGAIQCMPKVPLCKSCFLKKHCTAFYENTISLLPIKSKKIKKKTRYFNYLVVNFENQILLKKRTAKDIWQNLYEFPLIETEGLAEKEILLENEIWKACIGKTKYKITRISKPFQQILTHRKIIATFFEVQLNKDFSNKKIEKYDYLKTDRKNLSTFAFPKIIDLYLRDNSLNLNLW